MKRLASMAAAVLLILTIGLTACNTGTSPSSNDGGKPKEPPVAVTGITLNKTETTITKGESETLTTTISPENASNKKVTWSSGNTSYATVDANGIVTVLTAAPTGETVVITACTEDGDFEASCTVTIGGVYASQFMVDGIYYKAVSAGSTNVKVTNKNYDDLADEDLFSYEGEVTIPETVIYDGLPSLKA